MPTEVEVARALADALVAEIAKKRDLVLALPTGRTPLPLYRELVQRHRVRAVSFARVRTFNLDEFRGLPADHPGSFRAFMERHLFAHVDLEKAHLGFLDGEADDAAAECERYEAAIAGAGGIDLAIVGIGGNGHVAFNEPAEKLVSRTHVAKLTRNTRQANAPLFGDDPSAVPTEALTMGIGTVLGARRIWLIAAGAGKAQILARALEGEVGPACPASLLRAHPALTVWADDAAAAQLSRGRSLLHRWFVGR